jgi:hypothetical protein
MAQGRSGHKVPQAKRRCCTWHTIATGPFRHKLLLSFLRCNSVRDAGQSSSAVLRRRRAVDAQQRIHEAMAGRFHVSVIWSVSCSQQLYIGEVVADCFLMSDLEASGATYMDAVKAAFQYSGNTHEQYVLRYTVYPW